MAKKKSTQARTAKTRARSKAKAKALRATSGSRSAGDLEPADSGDVTPAIPDRRALEGTMASLSCGAGSGDSVADAQELMYQAWDEPSDREAIRLAQEALLLSPDCADAYNLLAERSATSAEEIVELYEQGVAAGERALGPRVFEEDVGHFWGILQTRPYMRGRHGLAQALWACGRRDEAIRHAKELLRLNPNDNQGIRLDLAAWLLLESRDDEAARLLKQYDGEVFAGWRYTEALLTFKHEGDTASARSKLGRAIEGNPHVPEYLLGHKKPPKQLPEHMGLGDDNEAIAFCHEYSETWEMTPGAMEWLRTFCKESDAHDD